MRFTILFLTVNFLVLIHISTAFDAHRQKRSPAGYDDYYKSFIADHYSDLDTVEDNNEYKSENDENSESSEDEAESSEDDFNGHRRRRSPAGYDDHYNKFIAEHFSDINDKHVDDKDEYKSASSESADDESGSYEEDDDEEGDAKANVKDHSFAYRNNNDYERIKELSEKQVEELHKKPGNCKQHEKDGMICSECKDPETGDTSESCAYASEPNDKKVAYLSRKSHNFKTPQVEAAEEEESEDEDEVEEGEEKESAPVKSEKEEAEYGAYRLAGFNADIDYDEPKLAHFKTNAPRSEKLIELLPKSEIGSQFQSRNLNQALTDFKTKDWSNCKKVLKGELTCYYCKDAIGATQEECMYVSSTNPKNIRVERHETKNYDTNSRKPTPTVPSTTTIKQSAPLKIAPVLPDNASRFARLRMGRPLMPTKASKIETAEPLVTPKTTLESFFGDDLKNPSSSNFKKTIKRTILSKKKFNDFIPAESRAIAFESHVMHDIY